MTQGGRASDRPNFFAKKHDKTYDVCYNECNEKTYHGKES